MSENRLLIAPRPSPLALWQAEHVKEKLLEAHPGLEVDLLGMSTQGDKILALDERGERLHRFIDELQQDLARIHSQCDQTWFHPLT